MPISSLAGYSTLSSNLPLIAGAAGLGGVVAGQGAAASSFNSLRDSMAGFNTFLSSMNAGLWITNADVATGAAIAYSKLALSNSVVAGDLTSGSVTTAKFGTIPACRLYKQADSTISDSFDTTINFAGSGDEVFDTAGMHDPNSNPSRITATTTGIYLVQGAINWPVNATGRRIVYLKKNGNIIASTSEMAVTTNNANTFQNLSTIINAASTTDYFELSVLQYSGSALTINGGGSGAPVLSAVWLGPVS